MAPTEKPSPTVAVHHFQRGTASSSLASIPRALVTVSTGFERVPSRNEIGPEPTGPTLRFRQGVNDQTALANFMGGAAASTGTTATLQAPSASTASGDLFNSMGNEEDDAAARQLQAELEAEGLSGDDLKITAYFVEAMINRMPNKRFQEARAASKKDLARIEAMARGEPFDESSNDSGPEPQSMTMDAVAFTRWLFPKRPSA